MTLVPHEQTWCGMIYINLERYRNMGNAMQEAQGNPVSIRRQTVIEQLDCQIKDYAERLVKLHRLKELLEENPVQKEVLSLTSELGFGHNF